MVAVAGAHVVQTQDVNQGTFVAGKNSKTSNKSPIHIGDSTMQKSQRLSRHLLSITLSFVFGVVFI
jgi:hypothetical protein